MNDENKKLTAEISEQIRAWLAAPETKDAIEATQKAADQTTGNFEVVITTENVDRYGEVIKLDGWELEHYRNNPVVLWGHDHHTLPVGIATSVEIKDGQMVARGKFAPHEFAQTVRQLYDAGIMRATSVGFLEKEREGNLITKAELIEFSFVSVPANPFALSTLVKSGISVNEMVTKGLVSVKEEAPSPTPDPVPAPADPTPAPADDQKKFNTKAITTAKDALKAALIALEALDQKDEQLEGNEETAAEDEETKRYKEFSEKRRVLQLAATMIGDVLAEARRAIE